MLMMRGYPSDRMHSVKSAGAAGEDMQGRGRLAGVRKSIRREGTGGQAREEDAASVHWPTTSNVVR